MSPTVCTAANSQNRAFSPTTPSSLTIQAGMPAKRGTRYMAPASPVFAGMPAPTGDVCKRLDQRSRRASLARFSGLIR